VLFTSGSQKGYFFDKEEIVWMLKSFNRIADTIDSMKVVNEWLSIGDLSGRNLDELRELLDLVALPSQSSKKELLSRAKALRKRVRVIL
jgi:hypothetical protein